MWSDEVQNVKNALAKEGKAKPNVGINHRKVKASQLKSSLKVINCLIK
jgi:hypothetical protein